MSVNDTIIISKINHLTELVFILDQKIDRLSSNKPPTTVQVGNKLMLLSDALKKLESVL